MFYLVWIFLLQSSGTKKHNPFFLIDNHWCLMETEHNLQSSLLFYTPFTDKSKFHYANSIKCSVLLSSFFIAGRMQHEQYI